MSSSKDRQERLLERQAARPKAAATLQATSASMRRRKTSPPDAQPYHRLMTPEEIAAAFRYWQAQNPEPRTELRYATPFQLLVAVVLSAQTTDKSVNAATPALFAAAPDACAMARLTEDEIAAHIRRIGLYRSKARHLKALATILCERYHGEVPRERAALEALPGVGRKTANVVLNALYGEATIAVDTHLFRVANRMGLAPGTTPRAVEAALIARIPEPFRRHAHHWLILHGRYVCSARQPRCSECGVAAWCQYRAKTPTVPGPSED